MSKTKHISQNLFIATILIAKLQGAALSDPTLALAERANAEGGATALTVSLTTPPVPNVTSPTPQIALPLSPGVTSTLLATVLASPNPNGAEDPTPRSGRGQDEETRSVATSGFSNDEDGLQIDPEWLTDVGRWVKAPGMDLYELKRAEVHQRDVYTSRLNRLLEFVNPLPGILPVNLDEDEDEVRSILDKLLESAWTGIPLVIERGKLVRWHPLIDTSTAEIFSMTFSYYHPQITRKSKVTISPLCTSRHSFQTYTPKNLVEDRKVAGAEFSSITLTLIRVSLLGIEFRDLLDKLLGQRFLATAQRDILVLNKDNDIISIIFPNGVIIPINLTKDKSGKPVFTGDAQALQKSGIDPKYLQLDRLIKFAKSNGQNPFTLKKDVAYQLFQTFENKPDKLICPNVSPTNCTPWGNIYETICGLSTIAGDKKNWWITIRDEDTFKAVEYRIFGEINHLSGVPNEQVERVKLAMQEVVKRQGIELNSHPSPKTVRFDN